MVEKMMMKLPDFICIGVAKAGTTSLHHALLNHPGIFLPKIKETFFFSSDKKFAKGINWYLNEYFSAAQRNVLMGEIAATYLYHGERVAKRLFEVYEGKPPKIIVIFRDPVHRAYSQYWHMRRIGWETLSFADALEAEGERREIEFRKNLQNGKDRFAYIENGLYGQKLVPYLEKFKKENFLFLLFDDLKNNYNETMTSVLKFIEAPDLPLSLEHRNEAKIAENNQTMYWNRQSVELKSVIRKIVPDRIRKPVGKLLGFHKTHSFKYPPLDEDLERKLRKRFAPEVEALSEIIGRDLSQWLP